jgi:signal transduction histidine kinase
MRCSILLLDTDGTTLRHGAAPSLPAHYCEAIDGLRIGPGVGSCGTAAFTRELTIVDDIATHEYWAAFRDLALPCGLHACWSTPIMAAASGECLGTFAMYYDEPRAPEPRDLTLIGTASVLAGALIEREQLLATTQADARALAEANEALEAQQLELELVNQQLHDNAAELEAMNRQLQDNATELELQTESLEAARAEAEAANRVKSDFLATMSHELRTPLNAIGGYAALLLDGVRGELTEDQRGDIERIQRSGRHLLGLINDILNFAKLEAGRVDFRSDDVEVAPLLSSLEDLVRPQVDAKGLAYTHSCPDRTLVVRGDAEKVRQILLNLVTNAVKFTRSGGTVDVACESAGDTVRITVRDTGRGIAPDDLARIFDPFVQVGRERSPESQQGVGLGLAISRDLAQGMGGSLAATSTPGKGSAFTLTLPRG